MKPDPMKTMQHCHGGCCDSVPDEVYEAVYEILSDTRGVDSADPMRDVRAEILAPRMADEGWRFCPCFPKLRTSDHARIFDLVHTNLANRLATKAAMEGAVRHSSSLPRDLRIRAG